MVKTVHYHNTTQKCLCGIFIGRIALHEAVCKSDDSGLSQELHVLEFLRMGERREGKESRSSCFFSLQKLDHRLGCIRRLRYDVLYIPAQRGFYCRLIFRFCLEKIRDKTALAALFLHDAPDAVSESLIPFRQILEGFQTALQLFFPYFRLAQCLVICRELRLDSVELFLDICAFLLQRPHLSADTLEELLRLFDDLRLLFPVGLRKDKF